ncbi:hypothetical protein PBCV1_a690aL [Paramecium bursaria Chlorella virus 1]|uniref:Uncharacterized protein n=1 Tax=Paramecium bursaria Chlorella virus 1 TaxID=10506 RepID=F8TU89_PBCV1|nr:hypothetical protein PBCV1_a690aL [Paramecium bursaria Chlorella virus 1]AEI70150.1 hypothetical protein [Paramecium bursaria Chlorella virus 1]
MRLQLLYIINILNNIMRLQTLYIIKISKTYNALAIFIYHQL